MKKVKYVGTPEPAEEKIIRTWPSSKPGKHYHMVEGADGVIYCTCPAWKFSKKVPKECKHMLAWAESIATGGAVFADIMKGS